MTIHNVDGIPYLQVRITNPVQQDYPAVNCQIKLQLLENQCDGDQELINLALEEAWVPFLSGVYTASHAIQPSSFLFNKRIDDLEGVTLVLSFFGIDATTNDSVHSITTFSIHDILFGYRFERQTSIDGSGNIDVNMDLFSEVVPSPVFYPDPLSNHSKGGDVDFSELVKD